MAPLTAPSSATLTRRSRKDVNFFFAISVIAGSAENTFTVFIPKILSFTKWDISLYRAEIFMPAFFILARIGFVQTTYAKPRTKAKAVTVKEILIATRMYINKLVAVIMSPLMPVNTTAQYLMSFAITI